MSFMEEGPRSSTVDRKTTLTGLHVDSKPQHFWYRDESGALWLQLDVSGSCERIPTHLTAWKLQTHPGWVLFAPIAQQHFKTWLLCLSAVNQFRLVAESSTQSCIHGEQRGGGRCGSGLCSGGLTSPPNTQIQETKPSTHPWLTASWDFNSLKYFKFAITTYFNVWEHTDWLFGVKRN